LDDGHAGFVTGSFNGEQGHWSSSKRPIANDAEKLAGYFEAEVSGSLAFEAMRWSGGVRWA
jgi:hypothetical protein